MVLTKHQFETPRSRTLEPEFEYFLKGNDPISLKERLPTKEDFEVLELLKKFKLVSSDSALNKNRDLIGESESKERQRKLVGVLIRPASLSGHISARVRSFNR